MPAPPTSPNDIVNFWRAAGASKWYRKDDAFDAEFRDRFIDAHETAADGELEGWSTSAQGALALCILLDQFPRNAFRGTPRMFANDVMARAVARRAIAAGFDLHVDEELRQFLYMPLMHSEDMQDQALCEQLTRDLATDTHRYAVMHRDIIERFGRFPHRNAILGRESTPDETRFLAEGGFAG